MAYRSLRGFHVPSISRRRSSTSDIVFKLACARNLPVELNTTGTDNEVETVRTRMLAFDDGQVYLDQVARPGESIRYEVGQRITAYLMYGGKRYTFESEVTNPDQQVQLKDSTYVNGLAIARPETVTEQQRRADCRVSLSSQDELLVRLCPSRPDDSTQSLIDPSPFDGRLVDISASGMAVEVSEAHEHRMIQGALIFAEFRLPEADEELSLLTAVQNTRAIAGGQSVQAGMKFTDWNEVNRRPALRSVAQFVAAAQRRALRRTR